MRKFVAVFLIAAGASLTSLAKDKPGKHRGHGHEQSSIKAQGFLERDRVMILQYCNRYPGGLPPGLAKRGGDLPPGLAKQLRRNGRLPPGLQKKLVPFPPDLDGHLTAMPQGVQRAFIGRFAVILNPHTQVVVDILSLP